MGRGGVGVRHVGRGWPPAVQRDKTLAARTDGRLDVEAPRPPSPPSPTPPTGAHPDHRAHPANDSPQTHPTTEPTQPRGRHADAVASGGGLPVGQPRKGSVGVAGPRVRVEVPPRPPPSRRCGAGPSDRRGASPASGTGSAGTARRPLLRGLLVRSTEEEATFVRRFSRRAGSGRRGAWRDEGRLARRGGAGCRPCGGPVLLTAVGPNLGQSRPRWNGGRGEGLGRIGLRGCARFPMLAVDRSRSQDGMGA